nr:MAG TPA: hypothetical protein [Caudoviricetes sp.]
MRNCAARTAQARKRYCKKEITYFLHKKVDIM